MANCTSLVADLAAAIDTALSYNCPMCKLDTREDVYVKYCENGICVKNTWAAFCKTCMNKFLSELRKPPIGFTSTHLSWPYQDSESHLLCLDCAGNCSYTNKPFNEKHDCFRADIGLLVRQTPPPKFADVFGVRVCWESKSHSRVDYEQGVLQGRQQVRDILCPRLQELTNKKHGVEIQWQRLKSTNIALKGQLQKVKKEKDVLEFYLQEAEADKESLTNKLDNLKDVEEERNMLESDLQEAEEAKEKLSFKLDKLQEVNETLEYKLQKAETNEAVLSKLQRTAQQEIETLKIRLEQAEANNKVCLKYIKLSKKRSFPKKNNLKHFKRARK